MLTGGLEGATAESRFARFWTLSADLCGAPCPVSLSGSMGAKCADRLLAARSAASSLTCMLRGKASELRLDMIAWWWCGLLWPR